MLIWPSTVEYRAVEWFTKWTRTTISRGSFSQCCWNWKAAEFWRLIDWTLISKTSSAGVNTILGTFWHEICRELLPFLNTHIEGQWLWWVGVRLCCNTAELTTWVLHWGCLYFTREFQAGQWTILEVKGSWVSYDSEQQEHITSNCTLESDGLMFLLHFNRNRHYWMNPTFKKNTSLRVKWLTNIQK